MRKILSVLLCVILLVTMVGVWRKFLYTADL